jgi:hypothetical protein
MVMTCLSMPTCSRPTQFAISLGHCVIMHPIPYEYLFHFIKFGPELKKLKWKETEKRIICT